MTTPRYYSLYAYFNGDHQFFFEGKWRSGRTLSLMLKRRHEPEKAFLGLENGRRQTMVVGTWDMTKADWDARKVTAGYALHGGSVFDAHAHEWTPEEKCRVCGMDHVTYDLAQDAMLKALRRPL